MKAIFAKRLDKEVPDLIPIKSISHIKFGMVIPNDDKNIFACIMTVDGKNRTYIFPFSRKRNGDIPKPISLMRSLSMHIGININNVFMYRDKD